MAARIARLTLLVAFLGLTGSACCTMSLYETEGWLHSKKGETQVDLSGQWDGGPLLDGGWGFGALVQSGNQLAGYLGPFLVSGAVNGSTVYLVLHDENCALQTARLSLREDGSLLGFAQARAIIGAPPSKDSRKAPLP